MQGPFVLALSMELATEGKPESNRQLAGLYLKNLITAQVVMPACIRMVICSRTLLFKSRRKKNGSNVIRI